MITNCRHHSPKDGILQPFDLPEPNHHPPRPPAPPLRISLTARRPTLLTTHSALPPPLLTWDPRFRLPAPLSQFSAPSPPFRFRLPIRILHCLAHTPTVRPTATTLLPLVRHCYQLLVFLYLINICIDLNCLILYQNYRYLSTPSSITIV